MTTAPNSSPELAAVLREIAEIEATPGFEGPKIITSDLLACQRCNADATGHCFEDGLVGSIGRACDARGWRFRLTGRYWPGKDALMCTIAGFDPVADERAIIRWGSSRALAAARAYRDAIKKTTHTSHNYSMERFQWTVN